MNPFRYGVIIFFLGVVGILDFTVFTYTHSVVATILEVSLTAVFMVIFLLGAKEIIEKGVETEKKETLYITLLIAFSMLGVFLLTQTFFFITNFFFMMTVSIVILSIRFWVYVVELLPYYWGVNSPANRKKLLLSMAFTGGG